MATTALMTALSVAEARFRLDWGDEIAAQRGGQVRVKSFRPDLWMASYACSALSHANLRELASMIGGLGGSRTSFYGYDPSGQYPRNDPTGVGIITPDNIKIDSLNADNQRLSLKGLPAAYVVKAGDYLAFDYGAGPSRALHQITTATTTANGSGVTAEVFVAPNIRTGASVNAVVTLIQAAAELMIVPGSIDLQAGRNFGRLSFDAIQVI